MLLTLIQQEAAKALLYLYSKVFYSREFCLFVKIDVLVSYERFNKFPQTRGLKWQKCILFWFWKPEVHIQYHWTKIKMSLEPYSPSRRESVSSSFLWQLAFCGLWLHRSNLQGQHLEISVFCLHMPFSSVCQDFLFPLIRIHVIALRVYPYNLG